MDAIANKAEFDERTEKARIEYNNALEDTDKIFDDDVDLAFCIFEKYGVGPHDARREDYPD